MPVRKRFGQHFLTDAEVIECIFAALRLAETDHVLEIGPGTGALTKRLCAESGSVTAVEIDQELAAGLRARCPDVNVVRADALRVDLDGLIGRPGTKNRCRIVGNLPYNIATPLLDRMFGVAGVVADLHVMLQAEVADRLTASPGTKTYGRLSVIAQYHCRIETLFGVAADSFWPPPKVHSAFVRLTPRQREPCPMDMLHTVLRTSFAQRRKVLANALKSLAPDWSAVSIDPGLRAENLTVQDFVAIANQCAQRHAAGSAAGRERR